MNEHTITRNLLGDRHGYVRGVGQKVNGVESSTSSTATSQANFGPRSSSCPTPGELAARVEAREAHEMV